MTVRTLSPAQEQAARTWAAVYETQRTPTVKAGQRMWSSDVIRAAKRAMPPTEIALLDLTAGKGLTLDQVSARTGRSIADLWSVLTSALNHLETELETLAAAD